MTAHLHVQTNKHMEIGARFNRLTVIAFHAWKIIGFRLFSKGIDRGGYLLPLGIVLLGSGALICGFWLVWLETEHSDKQSRQEIHRRSCSLVGVVVSGLREIREAEVMVRSTKERIEFIHRRVDLSIDEPRQDRKQGRDSGKKDLDEVHRAVLLRRTIVALSGFGIWIASFVVCALLPDPVRHRHYACAFIGAGALTGGLVLYALTQYEWSWGWWL